MIDLGVVNDFADNKEPAIFENLACGVSEINRALDTVAKAKFFRQAHRGVPHGDDSTRPAHFIDNVAAVVRLHLLLHCSHHVGCAQIDFLACRRAAGNKIRTHGLGRNIPLTGRFAVANEPVKISLNPRIRITGRPAVDLEDP
jgi:hypothetical protein